MYLKEGGYLYLLRKISFFNTFLICFWEKIYDFFSYTLKKELVFKLFFLERKVYGYYANTSFTLSAASWNCTAECTAKPELSMISLANSALVPCNLTIIGTWMESPIFL